MKNTLKYIKLLCEVNLFLTLTALFLRIFKSIIPFALLYIIKLVIDTVISMQGEHTNMSRSFVWLLIGIEFTLVVINDIITRIASFQEEKLGRQLVHYLSLKFMNQAASVHYSQYENSEFYDKMKRAVEYTNDSSIFLSSLTQQFQELITIFILILGIAFIKPIIILFLAVAIIPVFFSELHFKYKRYLLNYRQTSQHREMQYIKGLFVNDVYAKEIRAYSLVNYFVQKFSIKYSSYMAASNMLMLESTYWGIFLSFISNAAHYSSYVVVIYFTLNGSLSIGALAFLSASFRQVKSLCDSIVIRFSDLTKSLNNLGELFRFLEIQPSSEFRSESLPVHSEVAMTIEFIDVWFKYTNSETWALQGVNVKISSDNVTAIVGENGSGKTTIIKLLCRLYEPTKGQILLNGIEITNYNINELRANISVLFQDFCRYQFTLMENITLGNVYEKDNIEMVYKSSKSALLDKIIGKLPFNYNQLLGKLFKDGIELSGGEWQKVAIARAFFKNSPMLVLDEPFAALDYNSEVIINNEIKQNKKDKLIIITTHKESTLSIADKILVFEKGTLICVGKHNSLLSESEYYRAFWGKFVT